MAYNVYDLADFFVNLALILQKIGLVSTNLPLYNRLIQQKGRKKMTENEKELISIIRDSDNPEKVAEYMLTLFLDFLRTNDPSPEIPSVGLPESA